MRHVRLIAISDEYDTKPGLAIKGTSQFEGFAADRDGILIPHDLLEHQNGLKNMGTVWDELEALGGIWQVRGRWGDMVVRNAHSPETNLASDITRMFPEWLAESRYLGPNGLRVGSRPHDEDETFGLICDIARHDIPREYGDDSDYETRLENVDLYLQFALQRMRAGYRKAERRFGDRFLGINTFRNMHEALQDALRWLDYEGQEFVLSYGNGDATVREYFEREEY